MLKFEKRSATFFFSLSSQLIQKSDIFCLILIYAHYFVRKLIKEERGRRKHTLSFLCGN